MGSLAGELGLWHFEGDFMIFSDGSLGAGFKLSGFDPTCATNESINGLSRHLENLILACEQGLSLQFFYQLSPDVSSLIKGHGDLSKEIDGPYKRIADARLKFYRKNQRDKTYFVPNIYFFIRTKGHEFKKQGLFCNNTRYQSLAKSDFLERKEKFCRLVKQMDSLLDSAGLGPKPLTSQEWFSLVFECLNLDRVERIGKTSYRGPKSFLDPSVSEQLTLTDLLWDKEALCMGSYKFRAITLSLLPKKQTHASMVNVFSQIPFHFWISQTIKILDQSKEIAALEFKRRIAHSMASGSRNVSDLDSENKLSQIEGILQNLIGGGQKLVSSDFVVTIWGKSKRELDDKTDEVLKTFRLMDGAEGLQETFAAKEVFLKSLPGKCEGARLKKMKSGNASHLMPVFANWPGNEKPVCLLPTRDGGLFSLDPYADHLPNWNGIVFGGSGSGKSYSIVQLMAMFFGKVQKRGDGKIEHPRIVWIDNGASSKRLVEILNGEFVDLNLNSDLCLNMFDLKEGEYFPTANRIRTVLAVLEMILKEDDRPSLKKREKALLEEQVHRVYRNCKGVTPTLSDLKSLLDKHEDGMMRKFGDILYSWTGQSAYGKMLDGRTNVKLSKDLVSIEVQHLSNDSELKDVLLLLLTSHIQDVASSDIGREYLLIVDEAERLFRSELAKQVVITCYRTWRKFKSGIWCLSQNYKDFMADKALRDALMTNTSSVIILRQKNIDWDDFKKNL